MQIEIQEHMNQGIAYMAAENYSYAIKEFTGVLELDPTNVEALTHLGNAYACVEDYDNALNSFKTALMYQAEDGKLLYSIGGVYLLKNDFASAVRYYNRAEKAGYVSLEMYLILAGMFAETGDYYQAIRALSNAIQIKPLRADLYVRKATLQFQHEMIDEAIETLDELNEIIPDAFESYELRVRIYCEQKQFKDAMAVADEALNRFPNDPVVQLLKLQVLVESGEYNTAVECANLLLKAKLEDPILQKTILYKATAEAKLERGRDVIETLESYTNDHDDVETLYLLMNMYMATRMYENAIKTADRLKGLNTDVPVKAGLLFYRASALYALRKDETVYSEILPVLRHLSIESPQSYEIYIYRLIAHTRIKEYDKALSLAEYLLNAYPENPDGHLYKYFIYSTMGEKQKAEQEKKLLAEVAPDFHLDDSGLVR